MKTAQLSGSLRSNVGKKDAAALRRAEMVPCVLYGQGEQTHFAVKRNDIDKIVFSPDVYQVELDIEGKKKTGIIRELQQHPVKDVIMHVDFLELDPKKEVKLSLPVRLKGSSIGVRAGGRLMTVFRKLQVVGLPSALPEAIELDITKMNIGHQVRVKNIEIPGVTLLDPANAVVVSVKMARGAVKAEEEEEETEGAAEATTEAAAE